MNWTSVIAVYLLFWVMSAFLVMPFGIKTAEEAGVESVPGQAESAPANFSGRRLIFRTTILATILFGLYYINYVNGWIVAEDINFVNYRPSGQ
jgi:predicted secreted protein